MVILGEGSGQTLLARAEPLVASGPPLAELPVSPVLIRGEVDGQVLTQDVAAPRDVAGLLGGVHKQTPLVAMGTSLKSERSLKLYDKDRIMRQKDTNALFDCMTHHNLSPRSLALNRHPHPLILLVLNTYVLCNDLATKGKDFTDQLQLTYLSTDTVF